MASTLRPLTADLADPLYYLRNFHTVLDWVGARHGDLLDQRETAFLTAFAALPEASQALLVRMVMRRGERFRADRLRYTDVGEPAPAMAPLLALEWVREDPSLTLDALFDLFTRAELKAALADQLRERGVPLSARKSDWLQALGEADDPARPASVWGVEGPPLYQLEIRPLCDRFRLMFFGNLHQDWSEFVLTEQGTFLYETVPLARQSRPFQTRAEVDAYLALHACRERFEGDTDLHALQQALLPLLATLPDNPWLQERGQRLLFKLARQRERLGEYDAALSLYCHCDYPEARGRGLRVREKSGDYTQAYELARAVEASPHNEAERQQLRRLVPRLERKLGIKARPRKAASPAVRLDLSLPRAAPVELAVRDHMRAASAPVYYVENALLNGLFGLLCWDALFAPLPGAFFHPFQSGPADLYREDFRARRQSLFDKALGLLRGDDYRAVILRRFDHKQGIQSPFVQWNALDRTLLEQALACIPAAHLYLCFERLLEDPRANRAGLPDLIQLWPEQGRYRMVEVKGPGDRLQDNQRRWLAFFQRHGMPVSVCHVRWQAPP